MEEIQLKRWLRALEIAKCLFEEDGYFTDYLEEIERFIKDKTGKAPLLKAPTKLRKEQRNVF